MDLQRQDEWTLGVVVSVVVGGGVVLAVLLAVILAPLAPWLGSGPPIGRCTGQQSPQSIPISAASPAGLSGALHGTSAAPVSAASLSLRA